MDDVILIVDQQERHKKATSHNQKIDPTLEAQGLSTLIKPLGRRSRRIAIVAQEDDKGLMAYQTAGFETIALNGNRPSEIRKFIKQMHNVLDTTPPKHMVLVTTDVEFDALCDHAARSHETDLSVWAPSQDVPLELTDQSYGYRALEELLPEIKIARVAIRLDYENLHIGLEQQGWPTAPKMVIDAIKAEVADVGEIGSIVAYADWTQLAKGSGVDLQRELSLVGVEPRYQLSMRGKNSADMRLADEIRTLLEKSPDAPDAVDVVVLGTRDRDFRPLLETARARGKKIVLVTLKDGLSLELQRIASEVRYLDARLQPLGTTSRPNPLTTPSDEAQLAMLIEMWLNKHSWKWVFADKLKAKITAEPRGAEQLRRAIASGVLIQSQQTIRHADGHETQADTLMLNPDHHAVQAVRHFIKWAPDRITYCLQKGLSYVDSAFLAKGMTMDATFCRLNVGQSRDEAEKWLNLGATYGLLIKKTQPHPKTPTRPITTWWPPADYRKPAQTTASVDNIEFQTTPNENPEQTSDKQSPLREETPKLDAAIESSHLRQLITESMSDEEIKTLAFDHIRSVYDQFADSMPKNVKVQLLIEYAERKGLINRLLDWIREFNPVRVEKLMPQVA
jgi:uncharacterized LabA/DUF88 family protein